MNEIEQRLHRLEQWCECLDRKQSRMDDKLRSLEHLISVYLEESK